MELLWVKPGGGVKIGISLLYKFVDWCLCLGSLVVSLIDQILNNPGEVTEKQALSPPKHQLCTILSTDIVDSFI